MSKAAVIRERLEDGWRVDEIAAAMDVLPEYVRAVRARAARRRKIGRVASLTERLKLKQRYQTDAAFREARKRRAAEYYRRRRGEARCARAL